MTQDLRVENAGSVDYGGGYSSFIFWYPRGGVAGVALQ